MAASPASQILQRVETLEQTILRLEASIIQRLDQRE